MCVHYVPLSLVVNGTPTYSYTYDDNGALTKAQDLANGTEYSYYYDDDGTLAKTTCSASSSLLKAFSKKDDDGRVKTSYYELDYTPYTYSFLYCDEDESYAKNNDDLLRKVTLPGGSYLLYGYDDLLRRPYAKTYTSSGVLVNDTLVRFTANGEYTTDLISSYRIGNTTAGERVFTYTYDAMGNISQINEGDDDAQSAAHKYIYDEQNQLVVDVDYSAGCTRVYVYDTYDNIRSKAELDGTGYTSYLSAYTAMTPANTDTYTYGDSTWLDLLTAYNGNSITYDASGTPLTYYNGMTFTWGNVRQLFSLVKSDGTQVSYKYNMDGIRTEKTVGSVKTTYTVAGSMLLREERGNTTYDYYYDESGSIVGMKAGYNTYYYFGKNAQGDICTVYDGTGAQVASLTYDAYGNTVSVTNPNNLYIPFRYRGYYFDGETGFYYLQSRYYDPETGRFINADDVGYLGESNYLNLFAYCGNNPVMFTDPTGKTPTLTVTIFTLNDDMMSELYYRLLLVCKKWEDEVTIGDYIMWFCTAAIEVVSMVVCAPILGVLSVTTTVASLPALSYSKEEELRNLLDEMYVIYHRYKGNNYSFSIHLCDGYSQTEMFVAVDDGPRKPLYGLPHCFRFDEVYCPLIETLEKYSKDLAAGRMEALYGIPRYEYELPPGTSLL